MSTELTTLSSKVLSVCDLHFLLLLLMQIANKWKEIGTGLGFKTVHLEIISRKFSSAVSAPVLCFGHLLRQWLNMGSPDHAKPTVGALVTLLRKPTLGEENLSRELEDYQPISMP